MGGIIAKPRARYIPKIAKHEQSLQRRVCTYLRKEYPNVVFRSDYASGLHLTPNQAQTHARLQSGRAFPDLFIYEPSRGYHGLAIELKKEGTTIVLKTGPRKGHLTSNPHIREQAIMLRRLKQSGYCANFACGFDETVRLIDWYFGRPQNAVLF